MASKLTSFFAGRDYTFIAALLLFGFMAVLFTTPVQEGDFFWHVKTGQWIWEHKSLPSVDPFSHINRFIEPTEHTVERTRFLLRQYWLGQLALFGVWSASGEAGMVALRSIIYTGMLGCLYWWLARGKNGIIPLSVVFFIGYVLRSYPGERPQIFAFLFMMFLLYLLEQMTTRTRSRKTHALLLFLVMLAWSNCHGSFILGIVVIALYAACHILPALLSSRPLDRPLLAVCAIAIIVSGINPNGFEAFRSIIEVKKDYLNVNIESIPPLTELFTLHVIRYYYWAVLLTVIITIAVRFRSMPLYHSVVPLALAALSLSALRYIPFFVLAAPLALFHLPDWKPKTVYALLPLAAMLLWLGGDNFSNSLQFRAHKAFPAEAARFLNTARPSGNMFNYVYWGGYLMCYTDYPVFADGRGLAENFTLIHNQALDGINWKGTLSRFNINTIIIPGTSEGFMRVYPLLMQLHMDNGWSLIYQDDVALVFLRNIPENRDILERYTIGKDRITTHITKRLEWQMKYEM